MLRSAHLSVPGCVLRWSMVLLLTLLAACGGGGGGGGTATSAGANDNTPTTHPGALIVEVASSPMLEGMPIRFTGRASGGRAPLGIDWDFGDGMGPGASFSYPSAVTAAADGTLWVADFGNALLRRISTSGSVTTVAGCHPDWHMDRGCVYAPMGLSRDAASGDVYVASVRVGISRLRADGRIEPLLPGGTEARLRLGALPGAVGRPRGVALLSNGQLALTTDNAVLVTGFAP